MIPSNSEVDKWLDEHTLEDIRYTRTRKSLAEAITCRVYHGNVACRTAYHGHGKNSLVFAVIGKKVRVFITDDTVEVIREEFTNWRDAVTFAKGIIAAANSL